MTLKRPFTKVWAPLLIMLLVTEAQGYVGPGAAANGLASLISVAMAVAMLIAGTLLYPIKKLVDIIKRNARVFARPRRDFPQL